MCPMRRNYFYSKPTALKRQKQDYWIGKKEKRSTVLFCKRNMFHPIYFLMPCSSLTTKRQLHRYPYLFNVVISPSRSKRPHFGTKSHLGNRKNGVSPSHKMTKLPKPKYLLRCMMLHWICSPAIRSRPHYH